MNPAHAAAVKYTKMPQQVIEVNDEALFCLC